MVKRSEIDGVLERARVFELLGSFDGRGLPEEEFERRTLQLLDFPGAAGPEAVAAHFRKRFAQPTPVFRILANQEPSRADEILKHRFNFFGEAHTLPERIDWEHNPGTDHWCHDLNRFTFLLELSAAGEQTGRRDYDAKVLNLILEWIEHTDVCDAFPPNRSPYVWKSYLNIAIHLETWAQTLAEITLRTPDLVTPKQWLRILKSLHDQLAYLSFVIPEMRRNWVTVGLRGMLTTLAVFPEFRKTRAWTEEIWGRLEAALDLQILPDGAQDELAATYHMVVAENIFAALQAGERLDPKPPQNLKMVFRRMIEYMRNLRTPDGKLAAFGDSDPDSGPRVDAHLRHPYARSLLESDSSREMTSRVFPHAGIMVLRQGSRHGRDELYLAFDGGPYGMGHQHEDQLSFWLSAYGRSLIVDPGRHLYDLSERSYISYLKSTRAHSTITVDGLDQNSHAHQDSWRATEPLPLTWEVNEEGEITAGSEYTLGYGPQSLPVRHRRVIRFHPRDGFWIIEDELSGEGRHGIESRFQFAPGILVADGYIARTRFPSANLLLMAQPEDWDELSVEQGRQNPPSGWYSEGYNQIEPSPSLILKARSRALPFRSRVVLFAYPGAEAPYPLPEAVRRAIKNTPAGITI